MQTDDKKKKETETPPATPPVDQKKESTTTPVDDKKKDDATDGESIKSLADSVRSLTGIVQNLATQVAGIADPKLAALHAEAATFEEDLIKSKKFGTDGAAAMKSAYLAADPAGRAALKAAMLGKPNAAPGSFSEEHGDGEDSPKLSVADFSESATNPIAASKVDKAFRIASKKNPKLTFEEFRRDQIGE